MSDVSEFGDRMRSVRQRAGLSQAGFAAEIGVSASAVCYYENGRDVPVSVVRRICTKFGVDVAWLVGVCEDQG